MRKERADMKVLHLLVSGGAGGIEILMRSSFSLSKHENYFAFLWGGGQVHDEMAAEGAKTVIYDVKHDGMASVLKNVAALCRDEKIDVVISHNSAPLLKIALICIKSMMPQIRTAA